MILITPARNKPLCNKLFQPRGEQVARDAEVLDQIIKPSDA